MSEKDIIETLVSDGLVVNTSDGLLFTNKYKRMLAGQVVNQEKEEKKPQVMRIKLKSPDELLKEFIKDAEIPYRLPFQNSTRQYTVTARSKESVKKFYEILSSQEYKYEELVAGAKAYYAQANVARVTLSRFIIEGLLDTYAGAYVKAKEQGVIDPELEQADSSNRRMI